MADSLSKENPFPLDVGAATGKKLAQLWSQIIAVWERIER